MAAPRGGRLPFELHRVAEVLVGLALVSVALHVTGSAAALVAGLAVMAPALVTRGRLGVVRRISVRAHRRIDVLLVVLIAALPLVPGSGGPALAAVTEPAAAILLLLLVRTDYAVRRPPVARPPAAPPPAPPPRPGPPAVDRAARRLGKLAGLVERAVRAAADRDAR